MKEFTYVIKEELGLHARPAGLLVKEAKKFQSATTLAAKGKTAAAGKLADRHHEHGRQAGR